MLTVCAWCEKVISGDEADPSSVSHGICHDCLERVLHEKGIPLARFLDGLAEPVLVMTPSGTVATVNRTARQLLKKDVAEIEGFLGGVVFECAYASLPGGCGTTTHCSGCSIRLAVMETFSTGKPKVQIPVTLIQTAQEGDHRLRLRITTQRVGEIVLLRIDEISAPDPV